MVLDYSPKSTPKIFNSNKAANSCTQQALNATECKRNARRITAECRGMSRNAGDSCGMQSGLWRITKFTITEPARNGRLQRAEVAIVRGARGELMGRSPCDPTSTCIPQHSVAHLVQLVITLPLTHSPTHPLTIPLIQPPTHHPTHRPNTPPTHHPTHPPLAAECCAM